jgi:hypothetical protein
MRIYWSINSAPELRDVPVQERKKILRSLQGKTAALAGLAFLLSPGPASAKLLRRWQVWVIAAGFTVVVMYVNSLFLKIVSVSFYMRVPIIFFAVFVLLYGVVRPMQAHLMRPLVREHLERERQ